MSWEKSGLSGDRMTLVQLRKVHLLVTKLGVENSILFREHFGSSWYQKYASFYFFNNKHKNNCHDNMI